MIKFNHAKDYLGETYFGTNLQSYPQLGRKSRKKNNNLRCWAEYLLGLSRLTVLRCRKEKIGEGNDTPLQCSCLDNPMDRGD